MKKKPKLNLFVGILSTGLTSAVCVVFGFGIGYACDYHFHSSPWGVLLGLGFGFVAGFMETYRQFIKGIKELEQAKKSDNKN